MSATRSASCATSTECLPCSGRTGFTLVELLWAMTLSLVVMGAVASLFGVFTRSLTQAQAAADISARMRAAAWRLRQDLSGVTVDLLPPVRPEAESGYFEYFEGWRKDVHAAAGNGGGSLVADVDDVLMFTTRSEGQPFVGRYGSETIESPVAEVAWFCRPSSGTQPLAGVTLFTLYRRQALVVPYVGRAPFVGTNSTASFDTNLNDLSVRANITASSTTYFPNSLGDLTKRENRFLRGGQGVSGTVFPYAWATGTTTDLGTLTLTGSTAVLAGDRTGEDVVLSNILAFDVRVFDETARVQMVPFTVSVRSTAGSDWVDVLSIPQAFQDTFGPNFAVTARGSWITGPPFPVGASLRDWTTTSRIQVQGATAAVSGTYDLQILPPNFTGLCVSGSGPLGTYVDLGWGGFTTEDRAVRPSKGAGAASFTPPVAVTVGAAYPPAGQTAFQSGGVRVRGGTLATGTTALDGGNSRTYDTWSTHYESNGLDEDNDGKVDEGTNGDDDNSDGVPDDPAEAETTPPYPTRLRGLEIRIRCYEPESGQIRQTTLRHTFLAR